MSDKNQINMIPFMNSNNHSTNTYRNNYIRDRWSKFMCANTLKRS